MTILQVKKKIIPNQSRIIEQAKFPYSPLRRAFKKQITVVKGQGENQIKTLEEHGKQWVKSNAFAGKESIPFDKKEQSMPLDKEKKICYKHVVEKTEDYTSSRVKLEKLHNSVNFENLICRFMGFTKNTDFNDFIDAETTFDDIKSQQISSKM